MLNRLLPVLFVPAIACGGGGTPAPVPVDSPPVVTPDVAATACPETGIGGSIGTDAMHAGPGCGAGGATPCDWYTDETMGPNTGSKKLQFAAGLPDGSMSDILVVQVIAPFTPNTTVNFVTDAASEASYAAATFVLNNTASGTAERLLFASDGNIKLTETNETMNGLTKGVMSMTNYREVDDAGAEVAGGCTMTVTGLNFVLEQGSATFQKEQTTDPDKIARFKHAIDLVNTRTEFTH